MKGSEAAGECILRIRFNDRIISWILCDVKIGQSDTDKLEARSLSKLIYVLILLNTYVKVNVYL